MGKSVGKFKNLEYAKLDNIIAEHGKEFVIAQVITRVAEGCSLKDIAHSFGIHFVYLKRWMELECSEDIGLALRARADMLEYDASQAVDDADPDSVAVARLQSDHRMKLAGKLDRAKFGEKVVVENTVSVDLLEAIQSAERRVLAARVPIIIENGELIENGDVI